MRTKTLTAEERRLRINARGLAWRKSHPQEQNMYMYRYYKKKVEEMQKENVDYFMIWEKVKKTLAKSIKSDESFLNIPYKEQCFILQNAKILRLMEKLENGKEESRDNV